MNWTSEINFMLDGVSGGLKLVHNPFSMTLYQDGVKLKKKGGFGGAKYKVTTTDGVTETLTLKNNAIKGYIATFRKQDTMLERKLNGLEVLIGIMIPVTIFALGCVLLPILGGIIGGALLGGLGAMSLLFGCNLVRQEDNIGMKILAAVIAGAICYVIYFGLGLLFSAIFGSIFNALI